MFYFFFRCVGCQWVLNFDQDRFSFPFCRVCSESLVDCPPLCSHCGSPICLTQDQNSFSCLRPWIRRSEIHSYSGRYLLLNKGYQVLKRWKIQGGILLDRQVLKMNPLQGHPWFPFEPDVIIPIPQDFHRSWKMNGSRTERIASWIHTLIQAPVLLALSVLPYASKRQAELPLDARLARHSRFQLQKEKIQSLKQVQRILLVDDFMTSGKTLSQAAQVLQIDKPKQIQTFCLGIRMPQWQMPMTQSTPFFQSYWGTSGTEGVMKTDITLS